MKSITRIIIWLAGMSAIGLATYYLVSDEEGAKTHEVIVTDAEMKPVDTPRVVEEPPLSKISNVFGFADDEFTATGVEGVYTNSTKDKLLVIKEDIWKKLIRRAKSKFPEAAKDCKSLYHMYDLEDHCFVGVLTYFSINANTKKSSAYKAIEVRNGNAVEFAGGRICCTCEEGEPLVPQKVDAVVHK